MIDLGKFIVAPEGVTVELGAEQTADHGPKKRTITLRFRRGKFKDEYKGNGRTEDSAWKQLVKQHSAEIERDWGITFSGLGL